MRLKILILLLVGLGSCTQNKVNPESEKAVQVFVEQLKTGTYTESTLPDFNSSHIPELLKYRNDITLIKDFPRNPISSFWLPETKLGFIMLWNIESIRAKAIKSEFLIMGSFPSLNPFLTVKASNILVNPDKTLDTAAEAYFNWWNKNDNFGKIKNIDPLEDTAFRWF